MKKLTGLLVFVTLFFLTSCGGYEETLQGCIVESYETDSNLCSRGYLIDDYFDELVESDGIYIDLDAYTVTGQIGATEESEEEFDVSVFVSAYSNNESTLDSEIIKMQTMYDKITEDLNDNEEGIRVHVVLSVHFNVDAYYAEMLFYPEDGMDKCTIAFEGLGDIKPMLQETYRDLEDLLEIADTETSVMYKNTEVNDFILKLEFNGTAYVSSEIDTTLTTQEAQDEANDILDTVDFIFGE